MFLSINFTILDIFEALDLMLTLRKAKEFMWGLLMFLIRHWSNSSSKEY